MIIVGIFPARLIKYLYLLENPDNIMIVPWKIFVNAEMLFVADVKHVKSMLDDTVHGNDCCVPTFFCYTIKLGRLRSKYTGF